MGYVVFGFSLPDREMHRPTVLLEKWRRPNTPLLISFSLDPHLTGTPMEAPDRVQRVGFWGVSDIPDIAGSRDTFDWHQKIYLCLLDGRENSESSKCLERLREVRSASKSNNMKRIKRKLEKRKTKYVALGFGACQSYCSSTAQKGFYHISFIAQYCNTSLNWKENKGKPAWSRLSFRSALKAWGFRHKSSSQIIFPA